jgi:hypothetical protein
MCKNPLNTGIGIPACLSQAILFPSLRDWHSKQDQGTYLLSALNCMEEREGEGGQAAAQPPVSVDRFT